MSNKLISTQSPFHPNSRMYAYVQEHSLVEVHFSDEKETSKLHNIYVGKVHSIAKNLQAAFIEIQKGLVCYYPMEELSTAIFTKKNGKKPLTVGDELLVQVTKEGVKTKAPIVSTKLSIAGKYLIADTGFCGLRYSGKLSKEIREWLKQSLDPVLTVQSSDNLHENSGIEEENPSVSCVGYLFRTNSQFASKELLIEEYLRLSDKMQQMLATASYRTCYSLLYEPPGGILTPLLGLSEDSFEEVITDDKQEYSLLKEWTNKTLTLYTDSYPISKLYNLESQIMDATLSRVWLKSGAYLIIQPTEAFVAIDVNTGKFETGKNRDETFRKINLEASKEIARQLRLRRLSGIILIDFINMKEKEQELYLMNDLREQFREDPFRPVVVDMTKLGLVEVTRRKDERPLYDYLNGLQK